MLILSPGGLQIRPNAPNAPNAHSLNIYVPLYLFDKLKKR